MAKDWLLRLEGEFNERVGQMQMLLDAWNELQPAVFKDDEAPSANGIFMTGFEACSMRSAVRLCSCHGGSDHILSNHRRS